MTKEVQEILKEKRWSMQDLLEMLQLSQVMDISDDMSEEEKDALFTEMSERYPGGMEMIGAWIRVLEECPELEKALTALGLFS